MYIYSLSLIHGGPGDPCPIVRTFYNIHVDKLMNYTALWLMIDVAPILL